MTPLITIKYRKGPRYYLYLIITAAYFLLASLLCSYFSYVLYSAAITATSWDAKRVSNLLGCVWLFCLGVLLFYAGCRIFLTTLKFREILMFQDKVVINGTAFDSKLIEMKFVGFNRSGFILCRVCSASAGNEHSKASITYNPHGHSINV